MKGYVLVVEDFDSIRNFVCETLQRKGYGTLPAANGKQAFKVLTDNPGRIKLVLSDYNMPDCNGLELLKMMKENPVMKGIPVIFLTTESNPDNMRKAKEAGLTAWVKKPYRAETFFSMINHAITNGQ